MANPEQLAKIQEGVTAWNAWRESNPDAKADLSGADLRGSNLSRASFIRADLNDADLSGANLSGADLHGSNLSRASFIRADLNDADLSGANLRQANLSGADLSGAHLSGADLSGTNLRGANLSWAHLSWAHLSQAHLRGARLSGVDLGGADLSEADLRGANLSGAYLRWANLSGAYVCQTNFENATVGSTTFGDVDLSGAEGLNAVKHKAPSTVGVDTIYRSGGKIPDAFLRGAGVPDTFITFMHSLAGGPAIQFYSCFISYSSQDEGMAERLNADLRAKNLRCWFAPEDLKIGDRFQERIEDSIRLYDKVMIILSEASVKSWWVEREVNAAREREQQEGRTILFPIRIDEAVMQAPQPWAADIRRQRHIGDFRRWKEHDAYQKSLARLLRDLQQSEDKTSRS